MSLIFLRFEATENKASDQFGKLEHGARCQRSRGASELAPTTSSGISEP